MDDMKKCEVCGAEVPDMMTHMKEKVEAGDAPHQAASDKWMAENPGATA